MYPKGVLRTTQNKYPRKCRVMCIIYEPSQKILHRMAVNLFAETLYHDGVVVVPVPSLATLEHIMRVRTALDTEISSFPEFKPAYVSDGAFVRSAKGAVSKHELVKGGFAALGTPSSFHNSLVREQRMQVHPIAVGVLRALVTRDDFPRHTRVCQEIDRLLIRPAGMSPSAEMWHRDSSPAASAGDIVFGGWLNLDTQPQQFSCQLRTHTYTGLFPSFLSLTHSHYI